MRFASVRSFFALLFILFVLPSDTFGATFEVVTTTDTDCSDGACDFQSALTAAAGNGDDDIINLPDTSGLPGGYIWASTTFDYTAAESFDLVINGSESGRTELNGGKGVQILSIQATGGSASSPIGMSVSDVTFLQGHSGGTPGAGLAIAVSHANVTVENCSFVANDASAGNGGGAYLATSEFGSGSATIRNNTFLENYAVNGAGLWLNFPSMTIEDNRFSNNILTDTGNGGGAYVSGNSGTITIRNNFFRHNLTAAQVEACQGGGLYLSSGGFDRATVEHNIFERNQLGHNGSGAGAYVSRIDGPLSVEANIFRENMGATH